jgi:hypothetical protein
LGVSLSRKLMGMAYIISRGDAEIGVWSMSDRNARRNMDTPSDIRVLPEHRTTLAGGPGSIWSGPAGMISGPNGRLFGSIGVLGDPNSRLPGPNSLISGPNSVTSGPGLINHFHHSCLEIYIIEFCLQWFSELWFQKTPTPCNRSECAYRTQISDFTCKPHQR